MRTPLVCALLLLCTHGVMAITIDENPTRPQTPIQIQQTQLVQIQNNYVQQCAAINNDSGLDYAIKQQKLALLKQEYDAKCVIINNEIAKLKAQQAAIANEDRRREEEHQAKQLADAAEERRKNEEHAAAMAQARQEAATRSAEEAEKQSAADAASELSAARQYRDAKEWQKAFEAYSQVIRKRRGKPEAATADIELTAMKKDPEAAKAFAAVADEAKLKQCEHWLSTAKMFMANKDARNGAKDYLQKIIKAHPGGKVEDEAA